MPLQMVLCKSLRDTSSRLAELGWLHNKVRKYTDARSLDRAFGLVGQVRPCLSCVLVVYFWICCIQILSFTNSYLWISVLSPQSFCASLHQELKEYYRLLSVLHSQVHRPNIFMLTENNNPEFHIMEKGGYKNEGKNFSQPNGNFTSFPHFKQGKIF